MRGPVEGVPPLLQPVAHTLLQAREEINALLGDFPDEKMWEQPGGVASAAFHIQHIPGFLDRLFTYARGETLSNPQLKYLSEEGLENEKLNLNHLVSSLNRQIDSSIEYLKTLHNADLTAFRPVGRKKLPSTVIGLLFHAAEHTMRHTGQLLVTVRWVLSDKHY